MSRLATKIITAGAMTTGALFGANALVHAERASQAQGEAAVYQAQGDKSQAAEQTKYANSQELQRNIFLGIAAMDLCVAGGWIVIGSNFANRPEELSDKVRVSSQPDS